MVRAGSFLKITAGSARHRIACRAVHSILAAMACLLIFSPGSLADVGSTEYKVKAAFLLNFTEFIQWPDNAFADSKSPIVIGVLGDDPFGQILEDTFKGESVQGRSVIIRRSHQIEDLKSCQMLFICRSEKDRLGEILSETANTSICTVGDMDDFAQRGGVINFYLDHGKVRFEINTSAAVQKALRISAELLKRARIVGADSR